MARRAVDNLDPELTRRGKEWEQQKLRSLFLFLIQRMRPSFWESLNAAWRKHGVRTLEHWHAILFVVDPWFVKVICDTLDYWTAHPDSPEARLESGIWFQFRPACQIAQPAPPPLRLSDGNSPRVLTQLPPNILNQLDAEYAAYRASYAEYLRRLEANVAVARGRAAQFTVLKWAGATIPEIKASWFKGSPGLKYRGGDPDRVIRREIKQFQEDIALTILPMQTEAKGGQRMPQFFVRNST